MRRLHFYILIGLIWLALIVNVLFSYDYLVGYGLSGHCDVNAESHEGFSNLSCNVDYLIAELASSVFWGIFSTATLYTIIEIEDDEEEE